MVMKMARLVASESKIGGSMGVSLVLSWFLFATILIPLPIAAATSDEATEQTAVETRGAEDSHAEQKGKAVDEPDLSVVSKKVNCVGAHASCKESERVISILKKIAHYYSEGNFEEISKYLSKDVTTFDEGRHKLIIGKQAVLDDFKQRWQFAHANGPPVLSYTIYHPYAKVTGDQAVVTFRAVKTVGGKEPQTFSSHCTDVFVKEDGVWKKLHYTSNWKKDKAQSKAEQEGGTAKAGT